MDSLTGARRRATPIARRRARGLLLTLALAGLGLGGPLGCGSTEDGEELPAVTPEAEAEVADIVAHLNNESASERWRQALIDVGRQSPQNRAYVRRTLTGEVESSMARHGRGPGVLRTGGRRRAMEVVAALGDDPASRALLAKGLEDSALEVRVASAVGLADWGDERALPVLVAIVLETAEGDAARRAALQGLRRLAKPAHRDAFLGALREEARGVLTEVVLQTFPANPETRAEALRRVAGGHANPSARALALQLLAEAGDAQVETLAQKALDEGNPILRPVALAALGSAGGAQAADEIERQLRGAPRDPEAVVRGLYNVGTREALDRAISVLEDRSLGEPVRAAVASAFLGRLMEGGTPGAYRADDARRRALDALRGVLEAAKGPLRIAAIEALGRIGEAGVDVEILLGHLQTPEPEVGRAVVRSLGLLGGEWASVRLIELLRDDPVLRDDAAEALAGLPDPRGVPVEALIDQLEEDDLAVRRAALRALTGLARSDDTMGYDPEARAGERAAAVARWRDWWSVRRGR